tara:strand:+ start:10698 stop:11198 length:501 start_codon:yes stop_codon:yes gene_type:complete
MTVRDAKHKARVLQHQAERNVMDEDLIEQYRLEAAAAMKVEAEKRVAEVSNPEEDEILRKTSLHEIEDLVPALLARLGPVRAALDGHGGGIKVTKKEVENEQMALVLDLTGACLSCGAAPGTLQGVKEDLENDNQISKVSFCSSLLDTFDELGREFILAHGKVDFV